MATDKKKPFYVPYVLGGLAGMSATCVVQPVDLIKTRMQLSGEGGKAPQYKSSFQAFSAIAKEEGVRAMYKGLSAGAAGAVVGTPAEISLIRMTSDGRLPPDQRRGYKNVFDALARISKEEGFFTMWRGCGPTVGRAVILNAAQLGTYDQAKQMLMNTGVVGNGLATHFTASLISGFISTAVSIPIDMAKTRIQTMKHGEYKGAVDCIIKTARSEGVFSLWKGFTPYFLRLGPHTIITFIVLEQMNKAYNNHMMR